nr:MAG TPA: hypothetical protein [Bacteriophage sp.]
MTKLLCSFTCTLFSSIKLTTISRIYMYSRFTMIKRSVWFLIWI